MRLAERAGVKLETMQQVVHAGAAQSRVADHWSQQSNLKDTYTSGPRGLMDLMHKDLRPRPGTRARSRTIVARRGANPAIVTKSFGN
jgi:3-hydroxyisobutyrate dehydrogenase-like beta-hydroxyacid dehydrogenase